MVTSSSQHQSLVTSSTNRDCATAPGKSSASTAAKGDGNTGTRNSNNSNNNNNNACSTVGVAPGAGTSSSMSQQPASLAPHTSHHQQQQLHHHHHHHHHHVPSSSQQQQQQPPVNTIALASTILKSCPMYDTIAILIFLLQLPPIVLTLVHFLFASLTFMPPAGISTSALTSNFDIFQGPAGTPSLSTMIAMDAFCLLIWGLFMWTWAQNFAIDLAQVQVAITLGGGSSEKNGGVNTLCVLVVLFLHILRSQGIQDFVVNRLLSAKVVSAEMIAKIASMIPEDVRRELGNREPPQPPTWIRSLLAVHILAQAGTAMARRSMAKNRSPAPSKHGKRGGVGSTTAGGGNGLGNIDTEAAAGSTSHVDLSSFDSTPGATSSTYFASTQDSAPTTSISHHNVTNTPPAIKETRERISSAKKRRRQANQVRSRQPFWAALASTKVTVMREYEHSRTVTWSSSAFSSASCYASASATSSSSSTTTTAAAAGAGGASSNTASANYSSSFVSSVPSALSAVSGSGYVHPLTEDDFEGGLVQEIWITSIESSAIIFAASDFPVVTGDSAYAQHIGAANTITSSTASTTSLPFSASDRKEDDDATFDQQFDTSNPFHVYVNGAPWATVSMVPVPQNTAEPSLVRWRGEISGLAPDCTYSCSFVRGDTGAKISVMSVKTLRKSENEAYASPSNNTSRPSLRPSSPLTTMKNSVRSMEEQLTQRRQYLRKVKGDQKATVSRLRKEVENYANRLKSANDENKQRQRIMQLERTIKQTEEQIHSLSVRVKDSENVPELERAEWRRARSRFESEMEKLVELRADLDRIRKASNESVSAVQSEYNNTVQKRERLQARTARLTEQLERITVANEKGMNERERRAAEQLAREQERVNIEANFLEQITLLTNSVHDYQGRTANLWSQANAIDQAFQAQQQQYYLLHNNVNAAAAATAASGSALNESLTPDVNPDMATSSATVPATTRSGGTPALAAFSPFGQSAVNLSPGLSSAALLRSSSTDQFHASSHPHPNLPHTTHHRHHQQHPAITPTFSSLSTTPAVKSAISSAATASAVEAHTPSVSGSASGSNSNSNNSNNNNNKRNRSLSNFSGRSIQLDRNGTPYVAEVLNRPFIHENAAASTPGVTTAAGGGSSAMTALTNRESPQGGSGCSLSSMQWESESSPVVITATTIATAAATTTSSESPGSFHAGWKKNE
ncbi:hypothetical protein KEM54_001971 [Ascosphaera aggregata]|nr:hypothetical protein KEM54_001971 [Ascosphaera aggregata]